ncbi:universal stress protein [Labrys okinawensis]|uniref:Universal stress protein n=1 Tax=Labrys okinawensis TaxID=346911 RepID=A0A2S9Q622_9HYPH|nr:universal stress protein [Labrys okinawensis]PRH84796.1 universal stress protein [Labrys okinawensis]
MKADISSTQLLEARAPIHPDDYKTIAVHLDGSKEDEVRLSHAEMLAATFGAHLTGLFTSLLPDISIYAGEMGTGVSMDRVDEIQQRATAAIERLQQRCERLSVANELRRIEDSAGWLSSLLATEVRTTDLFIGSCPREDETGTDWRQLIEAVMFESGRSVYLVPPGQPPRQPIRTVLVCWTDTKEASRAVAEALPLLRLSSLVKVVTVEEGERGAEPDENIGQADIATYLARHGVETVVEVLPLTQDVTSTLLQEAHRISADLIVAGAYGHSRVREWIMGGTTVELVEKADIPLLMAH